MSTRSYIGIVGKDGVDVVYCHSGGYPSGVGAILKEHYTTEDKVRELISGGDFSSLASDVKAVDYYQDKVQGEVTHYSDRKLITDESQHRHMWIDYIYLFDTFVKKWYVYKLLEQATAWMSIEQAMTLEQFGNHIYDAFQHDYTIIPLEEKHIGYIIGLNSSPKYTSIIIHNDGVIIRFASTPQNTLEESRFNVLTHQKRRTYIKKNVTFDEAIRTVKENLETIL